jgi:hypothetical protein
MSILDPTTAIGPDVTVEGVPEPRGYRLIWLNELQAMRDLVPAPLAAELDRAAAARLAKDKQAFSFKFWPAPRAARAGPGRRSRPTRRRRPTGSSSAWSGSGPNMRLRLRELERRGDRRLARADAHARAGRGAAREDHRRRPAGRAQLMSAAAALPRPSATSASRPRSRRERGVARRAEARDREEATAAAGIEVDLVGETISTRRRSAAGFDRALEQLDAGEYSALIVARLDRAWRSLGHFAETLDRSDKHGWQLVLLDPPVDTRRRSGARWPASPRSSPSSSAR